MKAARALDRQYGIAPWSHVRCGACGAPANEVHHVRPKANGGTDARRNLLRVCFECHAMVHDFGGPGGPDYRAPTERVALVVWIRGHRRAIQMKAART